MTRSVMRGCVRISVSLLSADQALTKFCREAVSEAFGSEGALVVRSAGQAIPESDLCIWDYIHGETVLPHDLDMAKLRRHLFLLHRKHLAALQSLLGTSDLNVLLKPVTRATLKAFLAGAAQGNEERADSSAGRLNALRVERNEMLQVLIQANLKLQEYDQERNNFLARSVHDFRAPLTAIGGYCGLLLEEELGSLTSEQREVLERMLRSTKRLSRLANSMFQLSIPHNLDQKLNLENGDIRDCIEQALHEVALSLEDKRISVATEVEPPSGDLFFEKSQMEQTLVNLLDNACKFTPREGSIEIKGYPYFWERRTGEAATLDRSLDRRVEQVTAANAFRVDIRDSGPGIPPAHIEKIFEEYTAYSGGQDRSVGGLGLAICRMILYQHRGRIWAHSSNSGAVFSFVLPFQHSVASPSEAAKGREKVYLTGPVVS